MPEWPYLRKTALRHLRTKASDAWAAACRVRDIGPVEGSNKNNAKPNASGSALMTDRPVEKLHSVTSLTYRKLVCTPVTLLPVVDMTCARAIRASPDQDVDRELGLLPPPCRRPALLRPRFPTGRRSRRCRPFGALIELHQ